MIKTVYNCMLQLIKTVRFPVLISHDFPLNSTSPRCQLILSPNAGYVSRPSIGVELAPDAMSESLGMPGAMVMKALPGRNSRKSGFLHLRMMDLCLLVAENDKLSSGKLT